ncbi:MAG: Mur ligase family protein [Minisyncoccales bacterium]
MKLTSLKKAKILILGFGQEGQDAFLFLRRFWPNKFLAVADKLKLEEFNKKAQNLLKKDKKIKLHLGSNYLKELKRYEIIIKSPGISHLIIAPFLSKKQKITSTTDIFFENFKGEIIGVTGTKGKGTTASMIYQILKTGKINVQLAGNIGKPVLNFLLSENPPAVLVYELSSHQLFNLKQSPHIAVFLNLYPEHLDYYKNFQEYARAKANIALYQKKDDYLIYNSQNKLIREISKKSKAKKIPIKGEGYELNKMAAQKIGELFKIPQQKIKQAIQNFQSLPHRLEFIGSFKGIAFYNDALATIPEATIAALDFLGDKVETIILGGYDRGIDFQKLAKRILKSKIKNLILLPTTGEKIWQTILKEKPTIVRQKKYNYFLISHNEKHEKYNEKKHNEKHNEKSEKNNENNRKSKNEKNKIMKQVVQLAYQYTHKGKICLLSPASASFGLFKNYQERGNLFKKYVRQLKYE